MTWRSMAMGVTAWLAMILLSGCAGSGGVSGTPQRTPERGRQLLSLAGQEAGKITDLNARITRQLNIASLQIDAADPRAGAATLQEAMKTLGLPAAQTQLNDHTRMSGWVSVSELARQAGDKVLANAACDGGDKTLRAIAKIGDRCQYVMGLANEISHLRGDKPAVDLLIEGGQWAKDIGDREERRRAIAAFAVALFNIDRYDSGLATLQNEEDAAWRSDKLVEWSRPRVFAPILIAQDSFGLTERAGQAGYISQDGFYGKSLRFDQNFKGAPMPRSTTQPASEFK
jgi:hypothetical protein